MTSRVVRASVRAVSPASRAPAGVTDVMGTPDPRASTTRQQPERAGGEPAPQITRTTTRKEHSS